MPVITSTYGGLLALLFVFLSLRVIAFRRQARIGLGDGNNPKLQRRIRVHSNLAEYVPFCLVLMLLAELQNVPAWNVHVIGGLLTAGRVVHAVGVSRDPEWLGSRTIGMALTFTAVIMAALVNLSLPSLFL